MYGIVDVVDVHVFVSNRFLDIPVADGMMKCDVGRITLADENGHFSAVENCHVMVKLIVSDGSYRVFIAGEENGGV